MFVRIKRSVHNNRSYQYLQIVESVRRGERVRQRVIANLGRMDELLSSDQFDNLIRSMAKFSDRLRVIEAGQMPEVASCRARLWGPALVFERLWREQGLVEILHRLAAGRRFRFDPERVSFALALQRLCEPGSDLQGISFVRTAEVDGFGDIELQHLYRTVAFLSEQKEELERELFIRDRDLFSQELDLVFCDTTSTFVYRATETELRRRGHSRDHRSDLPQVVLVVAVDRDGWPVAWELLPGNTSDARAFEHMIGVFRSRFRIGRVIVVADRGMMSKGHLELLSGDEAQPYEYILGCRVRGDTEVRDKVLSRGGRYHDVSPKLKVKEVTVEGRRYVLCLNEEEAVKDAASREAIIEKLREKIDKQGAKSLIGNRGYARFLKAERGSLRIDFDKVKMDERYDGKFVIRTNTDLSAEEVAQAYKGLWRVERTFREEKSTLSVRPIYHKRDRCCVGHIVASFLALRLEVDLQRRLDEMGVDVAWPNVMRDLKQLQAVRISLDGHGYLVRTDFEGSAHRAFRAAGVRPPPKVTPLAQPPSPSREEVAVCSAEDQNEPSNLLESKGK